MWPNTRSFFIDLVSYCVFVSTIPMMLKAFMCLNGCEKPTVTVISESMEPTFQKGDILILEMSDNPIRCGDIVVFNLDGRDIPIVHRVIQVHERQDTGEVDFLTKGDYNYRDDRIFYKPDQNWLQKHHIIGRVVGIIPYVGWSAIILTEQPALSYVLTGTIFLVGLIVLED